MSTINNEIESASSNSVDLIFTRYLYIKTEVEHSMFNAILCQNIEQSLFWGFELFYSFEPTGLLEYLSKVYDIYYSNYSNLGKFLNKKCVEFADLVDTPDKQLEQARIIAIIIRNMTAKTVIYSGHDRKIFIMMDIKDILKYQTVESVKTKCTVNPNPRFILKAVCVYTPFREMIQFVNFDPVENIQYLNIKEKYYYHWLYYASFSTIWLNRISKYKGTINHKTRMIEFEDDDMFDQFYELYNYEPDEQTDELQLRNIPI